MKPKTRGNILEILQFLLLGLLMFLPAGSLWDSNDLAGLASLPMALGVAILIISFINLGKSLTANPVPLEKATLKTGGLYRVVRHPIYLGLILIAVSLTTNAASIWHLGALIALVALLNYKARFEEQLLLKKFAGYRAYAARVGRILPWIGKLN